MVLNLNDTNCLGLVEEKDNTAKIETKLQKNVFCNRKRMTKFHPPNMKAYGQQAHNGPECMDSQKSTNHLFHSDQFLSMIGSSQHKLAKWLSVLFQPLLDRYSSRCIRGSFTFAETIQKLATKPDEMFMYSFDIASLFTNISLAEAIQICADYLHVTKSTNTPGMEKHVFC